MYGVVGAADLAKFGLFMSLGVNKLTYANFSNEDDTIHAKTMTESLKDVFKPVLSLPIIPANHGSPALSFFTKATRKFAKIQSKNSSFNLTLQWNHNDSFHSMIFSCFSH